MSRFSGTPDRDITNARVEGPVVALGLSVPIPAKQNWEIRGVSVLYTSSAAVGNRLVTVEVLDDLDALVMAVVAGQAIAASTVTSYNFALGGYPVAAAGVAILSVWDAWPVCVALAGWRLRITDQAAISILDTAKVIVSAEWEGAD